MQAPVALLTPPDRYERQCYCLGLGRVFRARHLGLDNVTVHVTLKLITKLAAGGSLLSLDAILPGGSRLRILPRGRFVMVQFVATNHETQGMVSKLWLD